MPVTVPAIIERIAAKGDGITTDGQHFAYAAPGDTIAADGSVLPGPHHMRPPCRHFGKCGACQLQHCDDETLADFVRNRVVHAAQGQGLAPRHVGPPHLSPPRSRRRATLKAMRVGGRLLLGFNERASHRVVGMRECHVLDPRLFGILEPLRTVLEKLSSGSGMTINLALADQGIDCAIFGMELDGLAQTEDLLEFCRDNSLARLVLDQGYGPEAFWQPEPVTVTFAGVTVDYPTGAFLQATPDCETILSQCAREWLKGCAHVADLFAGLGTFAFALGDGVTVLAAEAARVTHLACRDAARRSRIPVEAVHRDLFRNPLRAEELTHFDGVLLDPPRAGAREQIAQLAKSQVPRIVYISCNPSSWARDGAVLASSGYELQEVVPIGQFRWSTQVELASLFVRPG